MVIATSQLLQWCDQETRAVSGGKKAVPGNPQVRNEIIEKFKKGSDKEELKRLTQELYVADPLLGARKAMELLEKLHSKYPEVALKQNLNE